VSAFLSGATRSLLVNSLIVATDKRVQIGEPMWLELLVKQFILTQEVLGEARQN